MTVDEKYMKQAIKQAKKAYAIDEVPIGCVIVNDADGNLALLPSNISPTDACMLSDMVPTGFHGAERVH